MWRATLLLQWLLHDEDAIAGFNTLRIIPLFEAFGRQNGRNLCFFLALTGEGIVLCGQNIDCVVLNLDEIKGSSQLFNLLCFLVVFIRMFKMEGRVVHTRRGAQQLELPWDS